MIKLDDEQHIVERYGFGTPNVRSFHYCPDPKPTWGVVAMDWVAPFIPFVCVVIYLGAVFSVMHWSTQREAESQAKRTAVLVKEIIRESIVDQAR